MISPNVVLTHDAVRFINYTLHAVPLVILYYDYLLTLGEEVQNYWPPHRPLNWPSALFLGTRYFTLLGLTPILMFMILGVGSAVRITDVILIDRIAHGLLEPKVRSGL